MPINDSDILYLDHAYEQALIGLESGGIPIGAVLVIDEQIVAGGYNKRIQAGSMIKHGETDCIENTARKIKPFDLQRATLYTSLSPCFMCAGTALLYKIPRIVIGENQTFQQSEDWLAQMGVKVDIANDEKFVKLMRDFIRANPELWGEDIGLTTSQVLAMYPELNN